MKIKLVLAALAFVGSATVAGAATVENVSGNVCEGGVAPAIGAPCPAAFNLGDFNSTLTNPTLEIVGDTHIWGGIAHRTSTQYQDSWTMDFGAHEYTGVFSWQVRAKANDVSGLFDALLTLSGNVVDSVFMTTDNDPNTMDTGSFTLNGLTGVVGFELDAVAGIFGVNPDEVATWDFELTKVPLPAGGVLLLSAIGGLGMIRARRLA